MKAAEISEWCAKASWSINEAAYLVHECDPHTPDVRIDIKSSDPVSKTHTWLCKELQKGRLHPISKPGDEERFSPGTLMRHLRNHDRFVSPKVLNTYSSRSANPGPDQRHEATRHMFRAAARLIWDEHPQATAKQVSKAFVPLPKHVGHTTMKVVSEATIRRYIKGISRRSPGRPKAEHVVDVEVDLEELSKKLASNN
jgi:hypothetical protein